MQDARRAAPPPAQAPARPRRRWRPRPPLAHGPRRAQRHRVDERRERDGRPRAFAGDAGRGRGFRHTTPSARTTRRSARRSHRSRTSRHEAARPASCFTARPGREDALARAAQRCAGERLLKSSCRRVLPRDAESCCDLLKETSQAPLADAGGTIQPVGLEEPVRLH